MLSNREREVAELVLTGLTYRQIGEKLFISAKTVEHHMARIRRRLGAQSRRERPVLRQIGFIGQRTHDHQKRCRLFFQHDFERLQ